MDDVAMTVARKLKVDLDRTPYYHCFSRCVRQSFLCGLDQDTGKDYTHRKAWIVSRIKQVADAFAIRVCAYAVMSNHYHVVLAVEVERLAGWDDDKVLHQWSKLYPRDAKIVAFLKVTSPALYTRKITQIKSYLTDISWFIKSVNEWIAKRANDEEGKKGRFWDGRFGSQALLDEKALLGAMVYVDLNPVRAGVSNNLLESDYTSIQERLQQHTQEQADCTPEIKNQDYIALVEETGRCLVAGKGYISATLSDLLAPFHLTIQGWMVIAQRLGSAFSYVVGSYEAITDFGKWRRPLKGSAIAKTIYASPAYQEAA